MSVKHPPWTGPVNDRNGISVVVCVTVFPALATAIVALRLFARATQSTGIGLDDGMIVLALIMTWMLAMFAVLGWNTGLGRHAALVPLKGLHDYLRGLYVFELIYIADFGACKVSILLFYLRIFATSNKRYFTIIGILVFTLVWHLTFEIAYVFQCRPIHYFWSRIYEPEGGRCLNIEALYGARATTNVISDLIIYIYPMFIVWKLQKISTSQKWSILGIFMAGGVVVIFSIVRATQIPKVASVDFTYNQVEASIFVTLEVSFGIIVACLPAIRSLFSCGLRSRRSSGYVYDANGSRKDPANSAGRSRITTRLAGIDAPRQRESGTLFTMEKSSFIPGDRNSHHQGPAQDPVSPQLPPLPLPVTTRIRAYDDW